MLISFVSSASEASSCEPEREESSHGFVTDLLVIAVGPEQPHQSQNVRFFVRLHLTDLHDPRLPKLARCANCEGGDTGCRPSPDPSRGGKNPARYNCSSRNGKYGSHMALRKRGDTGRHSMFPNV
jgi:hypothetical protein